MVPSEIPPECITDHCARKDFEETHIPKISLKEGGHEAYTCKLALCAAAKQNKPMEDVSICFCEYQRQGL